jgi:hypothetical protein
MPRTTKARAPALLAPAASLLAPAAALLVLLLLAAPATAARALKAESTLGEAAASDLPLGSRDPAASLPGEAGGAQAEASSEAAPQQSPTPPPRKLQARFEVQKYARTKDITIHIDDWNVSGKSCNGLQRHENHRHAKCTLQQAGIHHPVLLSCSPLTGSETSLLAS